MVVPGRYSGQLTGLCGDCNGKRDDLRTKDGINVSKRKDRFSVVGNSYQIQDSSDKKSR